MATIEETLKEIPIVQKEIIEEIDSEDTYDELFCRELLNYSTCYYYNLLSHACMNHLPKIIDLNSLPSAYKQYERETKDMSVFKEITRFQNISGLFVLWTFFEQFIFRLNGSASSKAGDFQKSHEKLLSHGIKRAKAKEVINTFSGIRRTRNSLHENGIYTSGTKEFKFRVLDREYILIPSKEVTPIRLMDLIKEMWIQYKELKQIKPKIK